MHLLSDIGKRFTAKYYENAAQRSYFFGCSEGGREAMIESAQRLPQDFDGIVAGRPRTTRPTRCPAARARRSGIARGSGSSSPPAELSIIQQAALAACDAGDGVKDGIVAAPEKCSPSASAGVQEWRDESECLTAP